MLVLWAVVGIRSTAPGQVSSLLFDLSNGYNTLSGRASETTNRVQRYDQLYTAAVRGYFLSPDLASLSFRTGLRDASAWSQAGVVHSSSRNRSPELFNLAIFILPKSMLPVSVYANKSERSHRSEDSYPLGGRRSLIATQSENYGVNASLMGNGYWPITQVGYDVLRQNGNSPSAPFDEFTRSFQLNLSNASENARNSFAVAYSDRSSEYTPNEYARSFNYGRLDLVRPIGKERRLSISASSRLWNSVLMTPNYSLYERDSDQSQSTGVQLQYATTEAFRHRTSATISNERLFSSFNYGTRITHTTEITNGRERLLDIGAEYQSQRSELKGSRSLFYQSASVNASWTKSFEVFGSSRLSAGAMGEVGRKGYEHLGFQGIHMVRLNGALEIPYDHSVRFTVSDDVTHSRQIGFGNMFEHTIGLGSRLTGYWSTVFDVSVTKRNRLFYDTQVLPAFDGVQGIVKTTSDLGRATLFMVQIRADRTQWFRLERSLSVETTVRAERLVHDLGFAVSGRYSASSLIPQDNYRLSVDVDYQLFAYNLQVRYLMNSYIGWYMNSFEFVVKRQIAFDFRR